MRSQECALPTHSGSGSDGSVAAVAAAASDAEPQLEDLREAAANILVGPLALRTRVLSEEKAEADDACGGKVLLLKRTVTACDVALRARPWDGCAPFYSEYLLQVRACTGLDGGAEPAATRHEATGPHMRNDPLWPAADQQAAPRTCSYRMPCADRGAGGAGWRRAHEACGQDAREDRPGHARGRWWRRAERFMCARGAWP